MSQARPEQSAPGSVGSWWRCVIAFDELPASILGLTRLFRLTDAFSVTNGNKSFGGTDPDPDIQPGTRPAGTTQINHTNFTGQRSMSGMLRAVVLAAGSMWPGITNCPLDEDGSN